MTLAALSPDQVRAIVDEGVRAFRSDPWLLVGLIEDIPECRENIARAEAGRMGQAREVPTKRALTIAAKPDDEWLRSAFYEGRSGSEVAHEVRCTESTIFQWWRRLGLEASSRSRNHVTGGGKPRAAVQEEREKRIRELFDAGLSQPATADLLGVSQSAVSQAWRRLGLSR